MFDLLISEDAAALHVCSVNKLVSVLWENVLADGAPCCSRSSFDLDVMLCLQVEELEEKLSDQTQEVERLRSELVRLHLDVLHPDKMF